MDLFVAHKCVFFYVVFVYDCFDCLTEQLPG